MIKAAPSSSPLSTLLVGISIDFLLDICSTGTFNCPLVSNLSYCVLVTALYTVQMHGTEAPVAQSVSARYLYDSIQQSNAEVVSSSLTWSTVVLIRPQEILWYDNHLCEWITLRAGRTCHCWREPNWSLCHTHNTSIPYEFILNLDLYLAKFPHCDIIAFFR